MFRGGTNVSESVNSSSVTSENEHSLQAVEAVAATCTTAGNTAYWYCSSCGKYYSDANATTEITLADTVISATGHTWNDGEVTTAATCTTDGVKTYTCTDCGETYTETMAATGHTALSYTSYDGTYHYYTCDTCAEDVTEAHTYENSICACGHEEGTSVGLAYTAVYDADDDTKIVSYTISGIGTCTDTEIIIPSTYNFLPVTEIAAEAFKDNTTLTSVTIPDSITTIGSAAFSGCSAITTVNYYGTASQWASIYFGSTYSNPAYFSKSLNLPDEYGDYKTVTEITIEGITAINAYAFNNNKELTTVTIGSGVTTIGQYAFQVCSSLTTITIGSDVASIGANTFGACNKLVTVNYDGTASQWASISFAGYLSTPVFFSKSLNLADDDGNYKTATEITIEGITAISAYAFYNNTALTSVVIASSVTSIDKNAFYGCSALASVMFENTSGWYVTTTSGASNGDTVTVTETDTNATNLNTTYYTYYWYRSES